VFVKKSKSAWKWVTSSGVSQSVLMVGGTGAQFVLKDPKGGTASFNYVSVGVGLTVGGSVGPNVSTESMMSTGEVYVSQALAGSDLRNIDFTGFCLVMEATATAGHSRTGTVMLVGIPASSMPKEFLTELGLGMALTVGATIGRSFLDEHPILGIFAGVALPLVTATGEQLAARNGAALPDFLISNAKAAVFMYGEGAAFGANVGASGSVGYVWIGALDTKPEVIKTDPMRLPVDRYDRVVMTQREMVPFPSAVLFDFDKADIKPDGEVALWTMVGEIQKRRPKRIIVEGHTDAKGTLDRNKVLSKQRADAVAMWLVQRRIASPAIIETYGLGHMYPAFDDTLNGKDNPDGRMRNRRIEMRFVN
jgi:outer membrane protein OmpA-like peptidoglycan-associated protein